MKYKKENKNLFSFLYFFFYLPILTVRSFSLVTFSTTFSHGNHKKNVYGF